MTIHTKVDILDFGFNFVKIARQMCFLTCKNNETMLHRQHSANYNDYKMNRLTLADEHAVFRSTRFLFVRNAFVADYTKIAVSKSSILKRAKFSIDVLLETTCRPFFQRSFDPSLMVFANTTAGRCGSLWDRIVFIYRESLRFR